jgi:hypothetical protein
MLTCINDLSVDRLLGVRMSAVHSRRAPRGPLFALALAASALLASATAYAQQPPQGVQSSEGRSES